MKLAVLILFAVSALAAQTLSLSGNLTAHPGDTVALTAVLTGSGGDLAAIQGTFSSSVPLAFESALANKVGVCAFSLRPAPPITCAVVGLNLPPTIDASGNLVVDPAAVWNAAPIAEGSAVATVTFTVPQTAPSGSITITVSGVFGVVAVGQSAFPMQGGTFSVTVIDLKTAAAIAFNAWFHSPTDATLGALVRAAAAVHSPQP